ncbi:MAG: cyclic nucleotide-binding domain-containing protein [Gammaproteobacteria bacterium]|nr:cyclic nucleotide-binding domain-containing protein [Gammaproteobacteria bacterium]
MNSALVSPQPMPDRNMLGARLSLVRELADAHREQVLAAGESLTVRAGATFCQDKREHEWVYYLISGALTATGVDRVVRELDAVSSGIVEAFHSPGHGVISARARTEVRVFRIPVAILGRFINIANMTNAAALLDVVELGGEETGDGLELALGVGVLSRLAADDIQRLLQRVEEVPVRGGEIIIEQGQSADCCYIVKAGVAEVDVERHGGTQYRVAFKGPGDFFGEEALITHAPRRATVRMRADGVLLRIADQDFQSLILPSHVRAVTRREAETLINADAMWLDMREAAEFQHGALPGAINLPESILRLRATSLDPRRPFIVCSSNPRQSALGNFMLTVAGLDAFYLDESINKTEATQRLVFADEIARVIDAPAADDDFGADVDEPLVDFASTLDLGTKSAFLSQEAIQIGLEDVRNAERQRYRRRLRKLRIELIAEADARVRAAVQEVELSYLTELENKHRQVLELKRKVALQHRELWKLKRAQDREDAAALEGRWLPEVSPDSV